MILKTPIVVCGKVNYCCDTRLELMKDLFHKKIPFTLVLSYSESGGYEIGTNQGAGWVKVDLLNFSPFKSTKGVYGGKPLYTHYIKCNSERINTGDGIMLTELNTFVTMAKVEESTPTSQYSDVVEGPFIKEETLELVAVIVDDKYIYDPELIFE